MRPLSLYISTITVMTGAEGVTRTPFRLLRFSLLLQKPQ